MVQNLGIFNPTPPSWSLFLNKAYVIKWWSFGKPPLPSTVHVHVVYVWPPYVKHFLSHFILLFSCKKYSVSYFYVYDVLMKFNHTPFLTTRWSGSRGGYFFHYYSISRIQDNWQEIMIDWLYALYWFNRGSAVLSNWNPANR